MFYNIHEIEMMHRYKAEALQSKVPNYFIIELKNTKERKASSPLYKIGEILIILGRRLQLKVA